MLCQAGGIDLVFVEVVEEGLAFGVVWVLGKEMKILGNYPECFGVFCVHLVTMAVSVFVVVAQVAVKSALGGSVSDVCGVLLLITLKLCVWCGGIVCIESRGCVVCTVRCGASWRRCRLLVTHRDMPLLFPGVSVLGGPFRMSRN